MSLDFVTLDHNCNVVRRKIEEEFRNLSLLFIPHQKGDRRKSFVDRRSAIQSKPHGRKIYDIISLNHGILGHDRTEFMGLIINNAHKFNILGRKHYTAVFFINTTDFLFQENSKQALYHLVWHALSLYQRVSKFGGSTKTNADKDTGKVIKPRYNALKQAKNNLMADIFSAILMEQEGNTGYIESLARKRSHDALCRIQGFLPEDYPYPLVYEASRLLYDDIKSSIHEKHLIQQVLDLTQEVGFIFDENSILQWWEFSRNAQEMAWQDQPSDDILGNAIYTSDNTDVRALAYQLAELLGTSPSSQTSGQGDYNPFAPEGVSNRLRDSQCEDIFGRLISIATVQSDPHIFYTEINRQNNALLDGKVHAWCAPALETAAKIFESELKQPPDAATEHPSEKTSQVFYSAQKAIYPETLKELSLCILKLRRLHERPDMEMLCKALSRQEELAGIHNYLDNALHTSFPGSGSDADETRIQTSAL